jgi:uncharacterized protein YbjT (DUF2867 family)
MPEQVLLTGATGFIGSNLHDRLLEAGAEVCCLTRRPEEARRRWPGRRWVAGDLGDPSSLAVPLSGCRTAFYLVHGMGSHRPDWAEEELRWARGFAGVAATAGVERLVYLGGVAPRGRPSAHLRARLETGEALRSGPVPCFELRAGMIVGAGSASWTIVRDLAARLPFMVLPAWLAHRSEPVALDDVVAALVAAARVELAGSGWWDLPGPEALSGKEVLLRIAAVLGHRPMLVEFPLVTPRLSSHWIRLVTRADHQLARELVEGLTSDLTATRPLPRAWAGLAPPLPLDEAIRRALAAEAGSITGAGRLVERLAGQLSRPASPRR